MITVIPYSKITSSISGAVLKGMLALQPWPSCRGMTPVFINLQH